MTWLWAISSLLILMSIAPFIFRIAGLSNFIVDESETRLGLRRSRTRRIAQ